MSLQFVMGPSGAGKSHYLYEWVTKEASSHPKQNYIVLVPEQFTLQTQKDLVLASPQKGILNIEVLSFHRLAQRVLEETGENTRVVLDDVGKNLVIRKVAAECEKDLRILGSKLHKMGYISEVKSILSEFMQYDIQFDELEEVLKNLTEKPQLRYKLDDIRLIYEKFRQFMKDKYITGEEILDVLSNVVHKSKIIKDSVILMDGFTGFTPVQDKLIAELLRICKAVKVSVTIATDENPYECKDPCQLFGLSKGMVKSLMQIAMDVKVDVEEAVLLFDVPSYRFRENQALGFLEGHLFRYANETFEKEQNQIQIWATKDERQEVEFVAGEIRRLVREEGYRYREVVVLTNALSSYANYVEQIFPQYEIPIFMDHKRSILLNACVEYVRSLLAMVEQNFTYESVFRYLRSGLANFTDYDIDLLENYVLAMGIKGSKKWNEKWVRKADDMEEGTLDNINLIRETFVKKLEALLTVLKSSDKTVRSITVALISFFMQEDLQKHVQEFQKKFEHAGELTLEKEYAQVYRILMELCNQFVELLGEEKITLKEYCELLDAGLEQAKVGIIPPSVDQVVIGDVERSRIRDVKAVFLIGASEKYIPGDISSGGLLSEFDRQLLLNLGMNMSPDAKEKTYIQKFYLYLMLTKPTQFVYLTYAKSDAEGKLVHPSYVILDLHRLFAGLTVYEVERDVRHRELSVNKGFSYMVEEMQKDTEGVSAEWQELYTWYKRHPKWQKKIKQIVDAAFSEKRTTSITEEQARILYGEVLENSVSRLEKYATCAYAHFLEYGLRLKERKEYQFNNTDLGILFHGAIEKFSAKLEELGYTWLNVPEDVKENLVEESVDECIVDYGNSILYSSARNEYIIIRLKRMMRRTVWALQKQLAESKGFMPKAYEVTFRNRKVDLGGQRQMRLQGKIDRMDLLEEDDKISVKVIDYKTGKQKFELGEVYHGLQMQLVVYLDAAVEMQQKEHADKKVVPAGLYYYRMKDPIIAEDTIKSTVEDAILEVLRLDGRTIGEGGELSPEVFGIVSSYARAKIEQIGREILEGSAEIEPYRCGKSTGCGYCPYRTICGFDERVAGYEYRELEKLKESEAIGRMGEEVRKWQ